MITNIKINAVDFYALNVLMINRGRAGFSSLAEV